MFLSDIGSPTCTRSSAGRVSSNCEKLCRDRAGPDKVLSGADIVGPERTEEHEDVGLPGLVELRKRVELSKWARSEAGIGRSKL